MGDGGRGPGTETEGVRGGVGWTQRRREGGESTDGPEKVNRMGPSYVLQGKKHQPAELRTGDTGKCHNQGAHLKYGCFPNRKPIRRPITSMVQEGSFLPAPKPHTPQMPLTQLLQGLGHPWDTKTLQKCQHSIPFFPGRHQNRSH